MLILGKLVWCQVLFVAHTQLWICWPNCRFPAAPDCSFFSSCQISSGCGWFLSSSSFWRSWANFVCCSLAKCTSSSAGHPEHQWQTLARVQMVQFDLTCRYVPESMLPLCSSAYGPSTTHKQNSPTGSDQHPDCRRAEDPFISLILLTVGLTFWSNYHWLRCLPLFST